MAVDRRVLCPAGREQVASEASQDGLVEEMGSKARMFGVERRRVAGANPGYAAKKDQRGVY